MGMKRLKISGFGGLDTHKGDFHEDASVSPDAVNFVCRDGVMTTAGGAKACAPELPTEGSRLFQAFFRDGTTGEDRRILMAAGGGSLYALVNGAWKAIGSGYASDEWEKVNYRSGSDELILLVNGADGMVKWDGVSDRAGTVSPVQGGREIAFSHLTLLYERLWGAVHADAPDRVYWSESFSPEDWEADYDAPDAGGGFVDVATFDGSRIRAIEAAFDDVLIFKDKSMHRLSGTYPGEFSLSQVYGSEGTLAARTIVYSGERLYFLGTDGLCVYNGMSVSTLAHAGDRRLEGLWSRMNRDAMAGACAAMFEDRVYLALPLDGAQENSHVLIYDTAGGCSSLVRLSGVKDWLVERGASGERLLCMTGRSICEFGTGGTLNGAPVEASWLSPQIRMGTLTARRTAGRMVMAAEAQDMGGGTGMYLTLMSGEKERTVFVRLKEGMNLIRQRIRVRGRMFRFRIENAGGCRLKLPAGLEIILEEDSDL